MGSEGKTKPHYNISMSRRTRKPLNLKIEPQESFEEREDFIGRGEKDIEQQSFEEREDSISKIERDIEQQKSLKQLIEGRCSLAKHFKEEEKQQQPCVVVRQPDHQDGFEGLGLKSMVRVFMSHLIKVKKEPSYFRSWKKPGPTSLKLIKHK